ncbi:MAG: hypothetical protein GY856_15800 [bacterium]|nr:hypothetical protein [bacterium]
MNQQREAAKKLGQILVERGWVTGEQLIRAIQSQRIVGGRIGTCLLEMDVVTEERLLEALADQLDVPAVRIEQLRAITYEVLDLVPPKVALRCQAIPFAATEQEVDIATLNVHNLSFLDELAFCTNRKVKAHIANEVRIFEALEKYYNIDCPRRYGHLLDRLNRARYMWDESAKSLLGSGGGDEVIWAEPEEVFSDSTEIIHSAASHSTLTADRPGGAAPKPPPAAPAVVGARPKPAVIGARRKPAAAATAAAPPLDLKAVDRLLQNQTDYQSVGKILLSHLAQTFKRCALFKVQQNCVVGWLAHGEKFDGKLFRAVLISFDQPSIFLNLRRGADFHLGPLPPMPAHLQLARCWGGDWPKACLMVPVTLRDRMVIVIYGDQGDADLAEFKIDHFKSLAEKASRALELCILRKKLQA